MVDKWFFELDEEAKVIYQFDKSYKYRTILILILLTPVLQA